MYTDSPVIYNVYSSGMGFICSAEEKRSNTLRILCSWCYTAHVPFTETQNRSVLCCEQYFSISKVMLSEEFLESVIDMTSSVEDDGMSYIRCKYLHPPRKELHHWWYLVLIWCTCFSLLLSFSPCQSLVCFPWFSSWQTKASMCPVFLVSRHVLPHPLLSY